MPKPPLPVPVAAAPERLVTLGEAAALLGVPDMALGRAVRAGRLTTLAGWREGRLLRLVRAGDLIALDPGVAQRPLPPEVETRPVAPSARPPRPVAPARDEVDLLREQVRSTREDNRRLLQELLESGREVRGLFDHLQGDEAQLRVELERQRAEQERIERALASLRTTRWIAGAALLLALSMIGWVLARGPRPAQVQAADGGSAAGAATNDGAASAAEALAGAATAEPAAQAPAVPEVDEVDEVPEVPEVDAPVDVVEEPLPESLDLPPADPDDPPCVFHALTRPGSDLRALIGPCSGRWSETHQAVAAAVRRGEAAYCRHHHFFATTLGGSVTRARELAAFSEREGLIPPLVELRVDRAGAAFLRRRVDDWIESGFEAGLAGGEGAHVLERLEGPDAWRVRSWVRYLDVGGVEQRRRFELELELDDGPRGDRLLAFLWTE